MKISALFINILEFYTNGKYHWIVCFVGRKYDPVFWGAPVCQPPPHFFSIKKAPLPEAHLIR